MFATLNCNLKHLVMVKISSYYFLLALVPIEFDSYIESSVSVIYCNGVPPYGSLKISSLFPEACLVNPVFLYTPYTPTFLCKSINFTVEPWTKCTSSITAFYRNSIFPNKLPS